MITELDILGGRVLSALLNGVYQGLLLTLLVWMALKLFPRTNAATRYAMNFVTLLVVAALPVIHFALADERQMEVAATKVSENEFPSSTGILPVTEGLSEEPETEISKLIGKSLRPHPQSLSPGRGKSDYTRPRVSGPVPSPVRNGASTETERFVFSDASQFSARARKTARDARALPIPSSGSNFQSPSPWGRGIEGEGETNHQSLPIMDEVLPSGLERELDETGDRLEALSYVQSGAPGETPTAALVEEAAHEPADNPADAGIILTPLPPRLNWQAMLPKGMGLFAMGLWLAVAGRKISSLVWQYGLLRAMKRRGISASENTSRRFDSLCEKMKLRRRPRLLTSAKLRTPLVAGFCQPAILLPAVMDEEPASPGLEGILRHELAHVQRRDDWSNLAQQAIKATLFFHPAVLWLSQRLTIDREIACDDHVLAATKHSRNYALYLTDFAGRAKGRDWAAAPAAWTNRNQLKERINMILDTKRNASTRLGRVKTGALTAAAVAIAVLAFQAGPRVAFGQIEAAADSFLLTTEGGTIKASSGDASAEVKDKNKDKSKDKVEIVSERVEITSEDGAHRIIVKGLGETVSVDANGNVTRTVRSTAPVVAQIQRSGGEPRPAPRPGANAPADPFRTPVAPRTPGNATAPIQSVPPRSPDFYREPGNGRDAALEERLQRLERMIESLIDQRSAERVQTFNTPDDRGGYDRGQAEIVRRAQEQTQKQVAREMERARGEIERAQQQVERQVAQARREAEINSLQNQHREIESQKTVEQTDLLDQRQKETLRNAERVLAEQIEKFGRSRNPFEQQKIQMVLQREEMGRQREALERRMEQLENEMDRLDDTLDQVEDQIDEFDDRMEDMDDVFENFGEDFEGQFEFDTDLNELDMDIEKLSFDSIGGAFDLLDHENHNDNDNDHDHDMDVNVDIDDAFGDEPREKTVAE